MLHISITLLNDGLFQVLLDRGCVYQERHGWERPGWFAPDAIPEVLMALSLSSLNYFQFELFLICALLSNLQFSCALI